jgi:ATP-binding cassette subfamily B protein
MKRTARAARLPIGTQPRQHSTLQVILSFAPYLWPKDNLSARFRVATAVLFMIAAKGAAVYVPILYARTVDALTKPGSLAVALPVMLIVGYGLTRVGAAGFGEIRDALFASVSQRAVRMVALRTYQHLHRVSLRFHLDRQTGGLSRVIDRGVLGMQSVLRLAVFNVLPTVVELLLVTGIIWRMFNWRYAAVTFLAVAVYVGFTSTLRGRGRGTGGR